MKFIETKSIVTLQQQWRNKSIYWCEIRNNCGVFQIRKSLCSSGGQTLSFISDDILNFHFVFIELEQKTGSVFRVREAELCIVQSVKLLPTCLHFKARPEMFFSLSAHAASSTLTACEQGESLRCRPGRNTHHRPIWGFLSVREGTELWTDRCRRAAA